MSEINYQALREVAEAAKGDTTWQNLQAFHAAATPEVVLALLDGNERLCRDLIARNGEIEGASGVGRRTGGTGGGFASSVMHC